MVTVSNFILRQLGGKYEKTKDKTSKQAKKRGESKEEEETKKSEKEKQQKKEKKRKRTTLKMIPSKSSNQTSHHSSGTCKGLADDGEAGSVFFSETKDVAAALSEARIR